MVFEDEHLAVIDKPAGLVVHPAPGHWDDTLVNALVARGTSLGGGAPGRPGIVHRLDRDTSGLLLVAKSDLAHRRLGAAIAARKIARAYAVLAWGHFDEDRLTIEAPIGRHPLDRKRMTVRSDGRTARTDLRWWRGSRSAICRGPSSIPDAPIRSGSTSPMWGIRSWATGCMLRVDRVGSAGPAAPNRWSSSGERPARLSTPPSSALPIR